MGDQRQELAGKVAIVTGSARNIGRAIAEELARAGAAVVINAVSAADLCKTVADGITADGGRALPFAADVRDPEAVTAMVGAATDAFGGIDILVHNAALRTNVAFGDMDYETFIAPIEVSIIGMFHLAKACVPQMQARGGGAIVGIGGMTSTMGVRGRAHVSAAKMGQGAFIRGLAKDLGPSQIRANNLIVGSFETDRMGSTATPTRPSESISIPLGRLGQPDDMAKLVRFVVGPDASYINGETIHCNGGAYLNL